MYILVQYEIPLNYNMKALLGISILSQPTPIGTYLTSELPDHPPSLDGQIDSLSAKIIKKPSKILL